MKRKAPAKLNSVARVGEIAKDFSVDQLAGIGSVAMHYNEAEAWIDQLLWIVTDLPVDLHLEVATRINGTEGKVEIIKAGLRRLSLGDDVEREVADTLGHSDCGFAKLKTFRDAIIHARAYNAPLGVGFRVDRRADVNEVLITKETLQVVSARLEWLCLDLQVLSRLLLHAREKPMPSKRVLSTWRYHFLYRRNGSRALPGLPQFPSQDDMDAAQKLFMQNNKDAIIQRSLKIYEGAIGPAKESSQLE